MRQRYSCSQTEICYNRLACIPTIQTEEQTTKVRYTGQELKKDASWESNMLQIEILTSQMELTSFGVCVRKSSPGRKTNSQCHRS